MANPAPIIITLPAFNVDEGVTIDFNIIGGTSIVRSNKLYVYDMDNNLIFTHLYASTYSIHELPARTDSSITYAAGMSSSNFTNEAQYYAIIQTFTDTAGSSGASGYSTAKTFWALPDPTLEISDIETPIEITSYDFEATYNTNLSITTVTNVIEQYQFDLYNASGTLISTTGLLTGSGEQSGTSTEYTLTYNFSGMEDGVSYYIVVSVITAEGMTLSVTSDTFTVDVDAPTLSGATATNNACDGYISIVSALSDEYDEDITKILVKRVDRADTSGTWLTLFSIDISEASDMNFTVIDFYNRYGREYQYALVPIMVQTQDDVDVEIEGNYTLSNIVESKFEGVYLADNTAIQRLQTGINYTGIGLRQDVGVIETIGNKYPIIVSNNIMNYYYGTLQADIFHSGFYLMSAYTELLEILTDEGINIGTDDNDILIALDTVQAQEERWSRTAIVAARETIASFLTNKSPKILKDWNGNIWLIMFTSDISFEFANNWGMGIVNFTASWTEIGNAEDEDDLQDSGLIDIGGV